MFYTSHKKSAARAFDYLYDPLYTVAGTRDFERDSCSASTATAPLNLFTNFNEMFGASPHCVPYFYVLQRNALPRVPSFNDALFHSAEPTKAISFGSTGLQRAKFFDVPLSIAAAAVTRATTDSDAHVNEVASDATKEGELRRTMGCQTMYREQSAQTHPLACDAEWPEAIWTDNDDSINDLSTNGHRESRSLSHRLENILFDGSIDDWHVRRAMLEAIEWQRWLGRENVLESNQMERLKLVEELMAQRASSLHRFAKFQMDESVDRLATVHRGRIDKIYDDFERSMRKLRKTFADSTAAMKNTKRSEIDLATCRARSGAYESYRKSFAEKPAEPSKSIPLVREHTRFIDDKEITGDASSHRTSQNLRLLYESLKALRLKQRIFDELEKPTRRKNAANEREQIAELICLFDKLNKIIDESAEKSVDADLELLGHKLDVLITRDACTQSALPIDRVELFDGNMATAENHCERFFLEDLLLRCGRSPPSEKRSNQLAEQQEEKSERKREPKRLQLTVDLHRLTSEEKSMIADVTRECVDSVIEKSVNE